MQPVMLLLLLLFHQPKTELPASCNSLQPNTAEVRTSRRESRSSACPILRTRNRHLPSLGAEYLEKEPVGISGLFRVECPSIGIHGQVSGFRPSSGPGGSH